MSQSLWISVARHRSSTSWKNEAWSWPDLCKRLRIAAKTDETFAEYEAMDKKVKAEKKDVGGFVGGTIRGGRRLSRSITSRTLLTLDLDFATQGFWTDFTLLYTNAAFLYSTHSHRPDKPRLRLIMPLSREVHPDEYEAIARRVAGTVGIELFDSTTFQPERLMYWPSTPKDMTFYCEEQPGVFLDVDKILATYVDWTDSSQWPVHKGLTEAVRKSMTKQGNPLEKLGVVGAFCRSYDITSAIAAYLPDVYTSTDHPNRWTYAAGSTASGMVVYDDVFAFSHHGTDPISGKLCNAFDLVRLHLYSQLDDETDPNTPINKRPSYLAMIDKALKDEIVSQAVSIERIQQAGDIFADVPLEELDWLKELTKDRKGNVLSTITNCYLILKNDPNLAGAFAYNAFENREVVLRDLPWRDIKRSGDPVIDADDACLREYIEKNYSIAAGSKIQDALMKIQLENMIHPVKDYLSGLTWDGADRIDTLLIDYFGAEDIPYTRNVCRKTFVAAVARVFKPGIKFDNVTVLVSEEGRNKSSFLEKIGRKWYSSDFGPLDNMVRALEQIQGSWIIEIAELAGVRKSDIETVKHFVSKTEDRFRKAFGKRMEYYPRQCIFIGTTNKVDFINGEGKNRRWWPVLLTVTEPVKDVWKDLTPGEINQIWAQAVHLYGAGEPLHLSPAEEIEAQQVKEMHLEQDARNELIREYLNVLLPEEWDKMDKYERGDYIGDPGRQAIEGVKQRYKVSVMEIWLDVFNGKEKDANVYNVKFIKDYIDRQKDWMPKLVRNGERVARGYVRKKV